MRNKVKKVLQFIANPPLLLCLFLAWMVTNGWSYVMLGIGTYWHVEWMVAVASAYIAFLWLPISPEKVVTIAIAIALLRWLFPHDQKTLAVLKSWYEKTKDIIRQKKAEGKKEKKPKD